MIRVLLAVAAFVAGEVALSGCATSPEVLGPLSANDVREINALVMQRTDIRKPILRIAAQRAGYAEITTGHDDTAGDRMNRFTMARRAGRWKIVSPVDEEQIILTSRDAHR